MLVSKNYLPVSCFLSDGCDINVHERDTQDTHTLMIILLPVLCQNTVYIEGVKLIAVRCVIILSLNNAVPQMNTIVLSFDAGM